MFCINLRWSWRFADNIDLGGIAYSANSRNKEQFLSKDDPSNNYEIKVFDPQIYFGELRAENCPKTCARLATYPWFPVEVDQYDENQHENITEWFNEIRDNIDDIWFEDLPEEHDRIEPLVGNTIEFQNDLDVTHFILSAPVIRGIEDIDLAMRWIDIGIRQVQDIEEPVYATLALSDLCLREDGTEENEVIDILVDQLTSRPGIDGVYFVLERFNANNRRIVRRSVARSILTMSYLFGQEAGLDFFVNYCGEFGLIAMGAGASHFASYDTNKAKRLFFQDYEPQDWGSRYPNFYSHSCLTEFRTVSDLEKIRDEGLLRYLRDDVTEFSEDLFEALENKDDIQTTIPIWYERLNNMRAAKNHYLQLQNNIANQVYDLSFDDRLRFICDSLLDAERNMTFFDDIIDEPLNGSGEHIQIWREEFQNFIEYYGLG